MRRENVTGIVFTAVMSVLGVLLLELIGLLVFRSAGWVDVSATTPPSGFERWLVGGIVESSVKQHARPLSIADHDPQLLKTGLHAYNDLCFQCHGAPGSNRTELARGINPRPPDLWSKDTQGMSDGELLWIVRNGIRWTGMPAFGVTHPQDDLQPVVAFIRRLPELKPGEYPELLRSTALGPPGGQERHQEGSGGSGPEEPAASAPEH